MPPPLPPFYTKSFWQRFSKSVVCVAIGVAPSPFVPYVASQDVQEELAADDGILVVSRAERLGPELDDAVRRRSRDARELQIEVAVGRGVVLRRL